MKAIQEKKDFILLRFEKGERFPELFEKLLEDKHIKGAFFYGIGGAVTIRCGYYDLARREYTFKKFSGKHFEICSMIGNVSHLEERVKIHAHLTFADEKLRVFGGHLERLEVGGTLELYVQLLDPMMRKEDEETGLALLD